jgi:hypothetical protein
MNIPAGVGIIASLHAFSGLFLLIHLIISIPFIIASFFEDAGLGFLGTFGAIWDWIIVGMHFSIAGAIMTRQSYARNIVKGLAIIGLIFAVISLISGNMFAIFSIIIHGAVIGYMGKPHVIQWFSNKTA